MNRCSRILEHELFKSCMEKNNEYEKDRIYCLHDMRHAFDTARIAYIMALESGSADKEIIYAAALIHDIGRCVQYEHGTAHDTASAELGRQILPDCGFSAQETELIINAVLTHRTGSGASELNTLLHEADKKSRMCMLCSAVKSCKWAESEMNMEVTY